MIPYHIDRINLKIHLDGGADDSSRSSDAAAQKKKAMPRPSYFSKPVLNPAASSEQVALFDQPQVWEGCPLHRDIFF